MMSVLRRPGLLLSAVATITVPGLLAVIAVIGHDHALPGMRAETVSLGADAPAASLPNAQPPSLMSAFATKASGMSMSTAAFGASESVEQSVGMSLLGKAAAAGLDTSYQGVEVIAQSEVNGTTTVVSSVWHRGGGPTVARTSDADVLAASGPYVAYDGDIHSPDGVFGVTRTLVGLIGKHYLAVYRGVGSAVGRPALIVELDRADGSLAARFWLDEKTMVPLQRDVYDTSARLVSEEAFVQVQFGRLAAAPPTTAATPAKQTWAKVAAPAKLLLDLDGSGWQLPAALPGGLSLYEAAQSGMGTGQVVDLGYSDGLSVISLFVQRGTLAAKMPGWEADSLNGHLVYVTEHSITWAGDGFVYTVIADAPPQTVEDVVAALPRNTAPGFFARIGRGLGRMAALVNPFH